MRAPANVADILAYISIYIDGEGEQNITFLDSDVKASYPDNTFYVDIAPYVKGKTLNSIEFVFHNLTKYTVDITLEDKGVSVKRPLALKTYYMSGQTITINQEPVMHVKYYTIGFEQQVMGNEALGCTIYPNSKHKSYSDCDDMYIHDMLDREGMEGYHPIWANKEDAVTNLTNLDWDDANEKETKAFYYLSGRIASNCGLPCSTTSAEAKFEYEKEETQCKGSKNGIFMTFIPWVKRTTVDFKKWDIFTIFSETGGSLGLWLGYCVLNLGQFCMKMVQNSQNFIKCS